MSRIYKLLGEKGLFTILQFRPKHQLELPDATKHWGSYEIICCALCLMGSIPISSLFLPGDFLHSSSTCAALLFHQEGSQHPRRSYSTSVKPRPGQIEIAFVDLAFVVKKYSDRHKMADWALLFEKK